MSLVRLRRAFLAAALLAACMQAGAAEFRKATHGPASLRIVRGIPVAHVYGTPQEMGEQQGALFGPQVRFLVREYLDRFLRLGGGRLGVRTAVLKLSRSMEKSIPAAYIAEMKALARAAGMDYEDILLANTVFDIRRSVFCSTFVVQGGRSADGRPLFGRNLDFPTMGIAHKYSCVIVYHPRGGRAVASVGFPGLIGVLSGLNDAGVAAAVMEVHVRGARTDATPSAMVFRTALTRAATTGEAVRLVSARARSASNNLMICDAQGDAACVELGLRRVAVRRPRDHVLYATNHFRSKELGSGRLCWRLRRLRKAFQSGGTVGVAFAKKLLARVAFRRTTMQSMVFRPASRSILLAVGEPPAARRPYVRLARDVLFPPAPKVR